MSRKKVETPVEAPSVDPVEVQHDEVPEVVDVTDVPEVYAKIDPPKRETGHSVPAIVAQGDVYTSEDEQRDLRAGIERS